MPYQPLTSLVPEFAQALSDEIATAQREGGQRYVLSNGRRLGDVSDGVLYRFLLDRTCFIPDEAEVQIKLGQTELGATVVSIRGLEIILSFVASLGDRVERLDLTMTVDLT